MPNQFSPKRPVFIPVGPSIAYVESPNGDMWSLIDRDCSEMAGMWNWKFNLKKSTGTCYVERTVRNGQKFGYVSLAQAVIGTPPDGMQVDHVNGVTTDNRRSNLRFATLSQQHQNQRINSANTSGMKGIHWMKCRGKWQVYINKNKRKIHLGLYSDIESALAARREAEQREFGEFSRMVG